MQKQRDQSIKPLQSEENFSEDNDCSIESDVAEEPSRRLIIKSETNVLKDKMERLQFNYLARPELKQSTHEDNLNWIEDVTQIFQEIKPRVKTHSFIVESMTSNPENTKI